MSRHGTFDKYDKWGSYVSSKEVLVASCNFGKWVGEVGEVGEVGSFWGPGREIEECLPSWQFRNWELPVATLAKLNLGIPRSTSLKNKLAL